MFNTTLTNELMVINRVYGWNTDFIQQLVLNAVKVTLLPETEKMGLMSAFLGEFEGLRQA
jgi:hypothetical protein